VYSYSVTITEHVSLYLHGGISNNPTVGTCWDADRLDLDRVGISVDASYMSTEEGRKLSSLRPRDRQDGLGSSLFTGVNL
jgi:hypothetical protein